MVWRMIFSRHSLSKVRRTLFYYHMPALHLKTCAGAHTYFFRHIFHDWPDKSCREILLQTIPAMRRNYSRIIIMDAVLPSMGASAYSSLLDINMIPIAGIERTNGHWRKLLEGVGLRILDIKVSMGDGIIEAVLADED